MGVAIDGSYHNDIQYTTPHGMIALGISVLYLAGTVFVIGQALYKWDSKRNNRTRIYLIGLQILYIIWQILNMMLNSSICNPIIYWLTNMSGTFQTLLVNIMQVSGD